MPFQSKILQESYAKRPISLKISRQFNIGNISFENSITEDSKYFQNNFVSKTNRCLNPREAIIPITSNKLKRNELTGFRNPRLNKFDSFDEDDDNSDKKQFIIEYMEGKNNEKLSNTSSCPFSSPSTFNSAKINEISLNDDTNELELKSNNKINQKKVKETVKMIENLLKPSRKSSYSSSKSKILKLPTKNISKLKVLPRLTPLCKHKSSINFLEEINDSSNKLISKTNDKIILEEEKKNFFKMKNIKINISTADNFDSEKIAQKPIKKFFLKNVEHLINSKMQGKVKNDEIASKTYLNGLFSEIYCTNESIELENNEKTFEKFTRKKNLKKKSEKCSLGLGIELMKGLNVAVIQESTNITEKSIESDQHSKNLMKSYQNLEELINNIKAEYACKEKKTDLKIEKLNRLKVISELSMKIIGRKFEDISDDERNALIVEANRFNDLSLLSGDNSFDEKIDSNTFYFPIKIINEDGNAMIEINSKYIIDPSEFICLYANKIIKYAEYSTSLRFDNITIAIPTAFGARQREAIKKSINKASDKNNLQILSRPVAAVVTINQFTNLDKSASSEVYKLVFDINDNSLDATVICIEDQNKFQVVSNVGDTCFGLHDIDQRILEYVIDEIDKREEKSNKKRLSDQNDEKRSSFAFLVEKIKEKISQNDSYEVDLNLINQSHNGRNFMTDKLIIDKKLIGTILCKDIYDWSLAHIEKAIFQANLKDKKIDEIIIIGSSKNMPNFEEVLQDCYSSIKIRFLSDKYLALGAAIVGEKSISQQIKVTEALCKSIGIGLYTGVITYLLFRNSPLPCLGKSVYSTIIDDQELMVLDIYEGERPHIKFCKYLGEVKILDLPKGDAGKVQCELILKMDDEGILAVNAKDVKTGKQLKTRIDTNPNHIINQYVKNEKELDPIDAERYKKVDYDLVFELESLDEFLDELSKIYKFHKFSNVILDKIYDSKQWLFQNRHIISINQCKQMKNAIQKFLKTIDSFPIL